MAREANEVSGTLYFTAIAIAATSVGWSGMAAGQGGCMPAATSVLCSLDWSKVPHSVVDGLQQDIRSASTAEAAEARALDRLRLFLIGSGFAPNAAVVAGAVRPGEVENFRREMLHLSARLGDAQTVGRDAAAILPDERVREIVADHFCPTCIPMPGVNQPRVGVGPGPASPPRAFTGPPPPIPNSGTDTQGTGIGVGLGGAGPLGVSHLPGD